MNRRSLALCGPLVLVILIVCGYFIFRTPDLLVLCRKGTVEQVREAIAAGAEVNAKDFHHITPLMYAAQNNPSPGVIIALVNAGADVSAKDVDGMTPLMHAARSNPNPGKGKGDIPHFVGAIPFVPPKNPQAPGSPLIVWYA